MVEIIFVGNISNQTFKLKFTQYTVEIFDMN